MLKIRTSLLLAVLISFGIHAGAAIQTRYTLMPAPAAQGAENITFVRMEIKGIKRSSVRVQMPVWSPGDYHVQNHTKYVTLKAAAPDIAANRAIATAKGIFPFKSVDANTWEITTGGATSCVLVYEVRNAPPGFFSENVRVTPTYAFYNGPAIYLYVVGEKESPSELDFLLPEGWTKAITPLDKTSGENQFKAPDYDTLADSPVVAGDFETRTFQVADRPHTMVYFNNHKGMAYDDYPKVLQPVVAELLAMMATVPYKQYMVFLNVGGRGGGLEHLNSFRGAVGKNTPARFMAGFMAHEFFHNFCVKRIRPEVLGPFDYVNPPKTRNLWFCEGVDDYFADLGVMRAGLESPTDYLRSLAARIGQWQRTPKRLEISADDSSLKVWEAGNSSGFGISYYAKGHLIGLCLDLKIRAETKGAKSFVDVMRDLYTNHGLPKPGFPEDGIRDACIKIGGQGLGPFYDTLARSVAEMPFEELFRSAGLLLKKSDTVGYSLTDDPNADEVAKRIRADWLRSYSRK